MPLQAGILTSSTKTHSPCFDTSSLPHIEPAFPATTLTPLAPAELKARSPPDHEGNDLYKRACPSGSVACGNGSCCLRACPSGSSDCGNGTCCPTGFSCGQLSGKTGCIRNGSTTFAHGSKTTESTMLTAVKAQISMTTTPSIASQAAAPSRPGGLSGGAIAGIVIGVIAGLLIGAAVIYLFLKRRHQRNNEPKEEQPQKPHTPHKPLPSIPKAKSKTKPDPIEIQIPDDKVAVVPASPGPSKVNGPVEAGGRELRVERHELSASPAKLMEWPDVEHPPPKVELDAGNDRGDMTAKSSVELPA